MGHEDTHLGFLEREKQIQGTNDSFVLESG